MADLRPPPTPVALIVGTAIVAGISGYMIGIASSLGFLPIPFMPKAAKPAKARGTANYDDEEESSEEEIDEGEILDHLPNWANGLEADKRDGLRASALAEAKKSQAPAAATKPSWADSTEECKLVLVVRTDLGMTKGLIFCPSPRLSLTFSRQNRGSVLSCHARLLQELLTKRPQVPDSEALGTARAGQGGTPSKERG